MSIRWIFLLVTAVLLSGAAGFAKRKPAQSPTVPQREAMRLVVMVKGLERGAGIIIGKEAGKIFVVTAAHVIRKETVSAPVEVQFYLGHKAPSRWVPAEISPFTSQQDLSLLTVQLDDSLAARLENLPFGQIADPSAVAVGAPVHAIGYTQGGKGWVIADGNIEDRDDQFLEFRSVRFEEGFSGGPLLSDAWQIIGMSLESDGTTSNARTITGILRELREWKASPVRVDLAMTIPLKIEKFVVTRSVATTSSVTARLEWDVANATACMITPEVDSIPSRGARDVTVSKSTDYSLVCEGTGGPQTATARVSVPDPVRIATFTAEPRSGRPGYSSTISWNSNASECMLDPGPGTVAASGNHVLTVNAKLVLTLSCKGFGGPQSSSVTLDVISPAAKILSFQPRVDEVQAGQMVSLDWDVENAVRCTLTPGGRTVDPDSRSIDVTPRVTTQYTLTCSGESGPASRRTTTVTVVEPVRISRFEADPSEIDAGDEVTLSWSSNGRDDCSIDRGVGRVSSMGSTEVRPKRDTTYTLTCPGAAQPKSVRVRVRSQETSVNCCDIQGIRRCWYTPPRPINSYCWCPNIIGTGLTCR